MQAKNEMQAIKALSEKVAGIVESGSNSNGSWVKYDDGTMMQWGSATFTGAETGNTGAYKVITFPVPFANSKLSISYSPIYENTYDTTLVLYTILTGTRKYGNETSVTTDTVYRRLAYTTDVTELKKLYVTNLSFNWQAVGFWK